MRRWPHRGLWPSLVASSCVEWLARNGGAGNEHKVLALETLTRVLAERRDAVSEALAARAATAAIAEMTRDRDIVPDLQLAANAAAVALAALVPNLVLDELLARFAAGVIPHYFVIKTLGDVAAADSAAAVPRLREILGRTVALLGTLKHDNLKWVFSTALYQFCEAIQSYAANAGEGAAVEPSSFSTEIYSAYEVLISKWSSTSERRLKVAVLRAIGQMTALFDAEQYEAQLGRVVQALVPLLGRNSKEASVHVTQALCCVLETGVRNRSAALGAAPLQALVLATLHPVVCSAPDFSSGPALKNYNETLRCFEALGRGHPEAVLAFVLGRLDTRDAPARCGSLAVLRHLVASIAPELEDKKGLVVSGVKGLAQDPAPAVRRALAQLVIAMASHEYLELEGGETLVEFIVRSSSGGGSAEAEELRDVCDSILSLATTTIPSMERVLWPYLIETLVPPQYTPATSAVCRSLGAIAARKRQADAPDYYIDFDRLVNLPKPQAIIAKLLVVLNAPLRRPQMGANILACLAAIGPVLHPAICDMWDEKLPKLAAYLDDKSKDEGRWDADEWEELVLRLLGETIRVANDDEWAMALGDALCSQLDYYKGDAPLRRAAMKFVGVVLQRTSSKQFIAAKLDLLFAAAVHSDESERLGCAAAFGYCSLTHIDMVLEKLQALLSQADGKKSTSLFSFGKSSASRGEGGDSKDTVLLAYGHVATYADTTLITSRVEVHVVTVLRPLLASTKAPGHRVSICAALTMIARAMHPAHLRNDAFVFKARDELVRAMVDYAGAREQETDAAVRVACLEALAALVSLQPCLDAELESQLLEVVARLYALNTQPEKDQRSKAAAAAAAPADGSDPSAAVVARIDGVLCALVAMNPTVAHVCAVLDHLGEHTRAAHELERERAVASVLALLKRFIQAAAAAGPSATPDKSFARLGSALAVVTPRVLDPVPRVRRAAVECVGLMLYIDHLLRSSSAGSSGSPSPSAGEEAQAQQQQPPATLKALNPIRDRVEAGSFDEQLSGMNDLSTILAQTVPAEEAVPMLLGCFAGMLDAQATSQAGVCVAAVGMLKLRGAELGPHVPELVVGLLGAMARIASEATMNGALHALKQLATAHLIPVVKVLLDEPMPHSAGVVRSLQELAKDADLVGPVVDHLADIVNNACLHEDRGDRRRPSYAPLPLPMAATAALGELCAVDEMMPVARARLAQLLCTLAMRVGTCSLAEPRAVPQRPDADGKPVKDVSVSPRAQVAEALRSLVWCLKSEAASKQLEAEGLWAALEAPAEYPRAVTLLVRVYCSAMPDVVPGLFAYAEPYLRGNYAEQRVAACAVVAELVNHARGSAQPLAPLVARLTESLADAGLKLHAVRGLGNLGSVGPEEADHYATTAIDSLTPPLSDACDELALAAMDGLARVLEVVGEERVAPLLVNLCAQIRPSFAKPSDAMRAAAFRLFGVLARFGASGVCRERFYEQVHAVLPALLVHSNDECPDVQRACKASLRRLAPLLHAPGLEAVLAKRFFEVDAPTSAYDAMMNDISVQLIESFAERVPHYVMACVEAYRSQWTRIRANAATLTGVLLANLPSEKRNPSTLNATIVTRALIALLKEKDAQVRIKAAEAMGLLHSY
eukprot:m51a1_g7776 hypothetical protein (1623) ;mRNA; f:168103-173772